MDSIKNFTIGAHQVPFTIERSSVGTITHYTGVLLGVHIVLRVAESVHSTALYDTYDIALTRSENSITLHAVGELWLSDTVSRSVADLNGMSSSDAFDAGLLVNFYPDKTCTYETIVGYVRIYFSHDRALYCYVCMDDLEDMPDVAWRWKRHADGWSAIDYGAFDANFVAFSIFQLTQILSHIKEV